MEDINRRLQHLIESDICEAENAENYREELIQVSRKIADSGSAKKQSKFFKALSDEKRIRILKLLSVKDMCVCELMIALDMTQPNLSHHLRILENEGIVERSKRGKWVYCSLSNRKIIEDMNKISLRDA